MAPGYLTTLAMQLHNFQFVNNGKIAPKELNMLQLFLYNPNSKLLNTLHSEIAPGQLTK
jgi:hypothetical protein